MSLDDKLPHHPEVPVNPVTDTHVDSRRRKRILVVEDNEVNQQVVVSMLAKLEYQNTVVGDGMQALSLMKVEHFDCILMDCQMPVMDGYETTKSIRNREGGGPRLPIIALTANAMSGDAEKCLASGMDDYLSKPFDIETLAAKLANWLLIESASKSGGNNADAIEVSGSKLVEDFDPPDKPSDEAHARKTGTDGVSR